MSDSEKTEKMFALAFELRGALDDPRRYEWGDSPWEHLGDAERDVRVLLEGIEGLVAQDREQKELEPEHSDPHGPRHQ